MIPKIKVTNKDQILKIYADKNGFGIPNVAMRALNMTAEQIKEALVAEMRQKFDRPTPYTLNAPYVQKATERTLTARVMLREWGGKSRSENYLLTQVEGGSRKLKSFEKALQRIGVLPAGMYATPGRKAPLDAYGNISAGFIVQIMSYFRAFGEQGYRANVTDQKKSKMAKGTKKKFGVEYFVVHKAGGRLFPGIWRRLSFNGATRSVEPMIMFVKQPTYHKLVRWAEIAQGVIDRNWKGNLEAAGMVKDV